MPLTRAWIDPKTHSIEGHTLVGVLTFNQKLIWGPRSCHDNTTRLRDALHKADSRFDMKFAEKPKTNEGHTAYISVSRGDTVYLDKLSTHDNMGSLCKAVLDAQEVLGSRSTYLRPCSQKFSEDKVDAEPPYQLLRAPQGVPSHAPLVSHHIF